jgi:hypothetical protein
MTGTQQIMPNALREHLVLYIAEQTGCTNPVDVWFAWLGFREGRVAWEEDGKRRRLTVTGADADRLRYLETGENPNPPTLIPATSACDEHFPRTHPACAACRSTHRTAIFPKD